MSDPSTATSRRISPSRHPRGSSIPGLLFVLGFGGCFGAGFFAAGPLSAQTPDPDYTLHFGYGSTLYPGPVEVPILFDHPFGPARGYSLGVCYDTSDLEILSVDEGSTVLDLFVYSEFFEVIIDSSGVGVGHIFRFINTEVLPPGADHEVSVLTFEATAPGPTLTVPLDFCTTVGTPDLDVIILVGGANSIVPVTVSGSVELGNGGFRRGDCNVDSSVNIADAIFLGAWLFDATLPAFCLEACDANGDVGINIADMIYILNHLYASGQPPPPPFSECGQDPEPASGFGCEELSICP